MWCHGDDKPLSRAVDPVHAARFTETMAEMQKVAADRAKLVDSLQRFDTAEVS